MSQRAKRHTHRLRGNAFPAGLRRLLVVSASVHVGIVLGVIVWSSIAHTANSAEPQKFIATKLVKLGKKRDKTLLPRIPSTPPPAAREAVSLDTPKEPVKKSAEADQKQVPTAQERLTQMSSLSNALERVRKTADQPEGDPEGVEGGEVTDASQAIIGMKFATEISRCVKENFTVEGMDETKAKRLSATILVRVKPNGRLFDPKVQASSKNRIFDASVLAAAQKCGKVSPPPKELEEQLHRQGILFVFKP